MKDKQIEEMRYLADEMGKAISNEYEKRVLADERKLEAVLKENGWRKASDVAREIFEEIEGNILHIVNHKFIECQRHHEHNSYTQMLQAQISVLRILLNYIAELKKKYAEEDL